MRTLTASHADDKSLVVGREQGTLWITELRISHILTHAQALCIGSKKVESTRSPRSGRESLFWKLDAASTRPSPHSSPRPIDGKDEELERRFNAIDSFDMGFVASFGISPAKVSFRCTDAQRMKWTHAHVLNFDLTDASTSVQTFTLVSVCGETHNVLKIVVKRVPSSPTSVSPSTPGFAVTSL